MPMPMPMTRRRRVLLRTAGAILLVVAVTWASVAAYRRVRYGREYDESRPAVRVGTGDRFSVEVHDRGGSVGDSWTAKTEPEGLLTARGDVLRGTFLISDVLPASDGCCGGTRLFTFDAGRPGTVTVTLSNCFQGCDSPTGRRYSRSVAWAVTVG
jgi:hypothetical protein